MSLFLTVIFPFSLLFVLFSYNAKPCEVRANCQFLHFTFYRSSMSKANQASNPFWVFIFPLRENRSGPCMYSEQQKRRQRPSAAAASDCGKFSMPSAHTQARVSEGGSVHIRIHVHACGNGKEKRRACGSKLLATTSLNVKNKGFFYSVTRIHCHL